jgi:hypothetical protein
MTTLFSRKAFNQTIDRLDIDIDRPEETAGSEEQPQESYGRAFHYPWKVASSISLPQLEGCTSGIAEG